MNLNSPGGPTLTTSSEHRHLADITLPNANLEQFGSCHEFGANTNMDPKQIAKWETCHILISVLTVKPL